MVLCDCLLAMIKTSVLYETAAMLANVRLKNEGNLFS